MKKCPYCAEEIQDDAIKCRYCESDLSGSPFVPEQDLVAHPLRDGVPPAPRASALKDGPPAAIPRTQGRSRRRWQLAISLLAIAIIITASLLFTQLASANSSLSKERTKVTDLNAQVTDLKAQVSGLAGHVSDLDSKVESCRSAARVLSDVWDLTLKEQKIDNQATRAANLGFFSLSHFYTARANVLIHQMNAQVRSASSDIRACGLPEPVSVSSF